MALREALRIVGLEFEQKEIKLLLQLRASSSRVHGDPVRLQQIFWNLLRNAAKFTPRRGRVKIKSANPGPDRITIAITDTGIGMTAEEIEGAFEPFAQGQHAATNQFGGLGLGLSISQKLARLHAGGIRIASAGRKQGATLTVELPLQTWASRMPRGTG